MGVPRTVPNLPGSLIRQLARRLNTTATTAMRVALLYGDIEWKAAGDPQLSYSASDYGRRQGLHRHTVQADLRRLVRLGAISVRYDSCNSAQLLLHGLGGQLEGDAGGEPERDQALAGSLPTHGEQYNSALVEPIANPGRSDQATPVEEFDNPLAFSSTSPPGDSVDNPCRSLQQHPVDGIDNPGQSDRQPPVELFDNPLSTASTTLEKDLKTLEKKKTRRLLLLPQSQVQSGHKVQTKAGSSSPQVEHLPRAGLGPKASNVPTAAPPEAGFQAEPTVRSTDRPTGSPEPAAQKGPEPAASSTSGELTADLQDLLGAFQTHCPAAWTAPQTLTPSAGRLAKLRVALAHAGGQHLLRQRLIQALAKVPPWFLSTYPQRPDGSRRPPHHFFDLLFRAPGQERDCGPEAWHLFAWGQESPAKADLSQQGIGPGKDQAGATKSSNQVEDPELQRARRLFYWDTHNWCAVGIEALELSLNQKRQLTESLEQAGLGIAGTAARQYADNAPSLPPIPWH